jgi:IclR family transcriptional regulator, pca regulon regulatory protein
LEYGVAILESFTANRPMLRISELADMVGISRSTTHRYATTLVELGFLEQDSKRRYRLAHNAARAGMALIETLRRENPARAILEDLREQTGHTVSLGLLDRAQVLYVYRLHAHGPGQYETDGELGVGSYAPAHSTAIGRALLSSLIESELCDLFAQLCRYGSEPGAVPVDTSLVGEIEQVKRERIAVCDGEYPTGARSIAAPVTRRLDKPILAVGLTAPASAYTIDEMLVRFGEPVRRAAKLLSV